MEYIKKLPSYNLSAFIESLVQKYKLEDYTQDPDPEIKKLLLSANSLEEVAALKLLHDDDFYKYSTKLWGVLNNLINKKIALNDLQNYISKELLLPPNVSQALASEIQNSQLVNDEINTPLELEEDDFGLTPPNQESSRRGLGQELM
jgi:hypothetical protein